MPYDTFGRESVTPDPSAFEFEGGFNHYLSHSFTNLQFYPLLFCLFRELEKNIKNSPKFLLCILISL
jgi:hypothetical protein